MGCGLLLVGVVWLGSGELGGWVGGEVGGGGGGGGGGGSRGLVGVIVMDGWGVGVFRGLRHVLHQMCKPDPRNVF